MELRQLRYFLCVSETEHLTQAAHAMFVTQSTLSHGLRQLETELGVTLFDRVGRGLKISQAGLLFKGYVGRAVQEIEAGRMELSRLNGLQAGTLTVGVIPTFMNSLVPTAVAYFSEKYPGIKVSIRDLRADLIEELLMAGQLDVGIAFHPTEREEIDTTHLFTEKMQLLVGKNHPLAGKRSVSMKTLKNMPLCLLPRSFATRRMLDESFKMAGLSPLVRVEMESVGALIAACASGLLATIVPERAARESGHMHAITLTDPQPARHAGVLWRKGASRSVAAQAFVAMLQPDK
ncbi:MAG: transcriptional regulator CynR [Burkholderiaceae bacterium]|nr:transcriptional regulator CynR [Burkholderiaceae bacterium]